ncbi:MAG: amidophosphoribosyltransferase [Desulfobulbus sp.]|jgi:amidophosphoribosyltransferase|uniref:amidophosphoribosyltransferase n=1 Tax=Desulfobulbus sp. TaxID=895 RepID=UPI002844ED7A|nr:amidophosphoribosyltransferase [Desulfobulbus sp.]MDR2549673.1 amidophosphoribosyltransferase [Desulfobulbus sp.]
MNTFETDQQFSGKPRHECGICGVYGHQDAAKLVYFGLYALQHRGQESAGIVAGDGKKVLIHKDMGLVADVFSERTLQRLTGHLAIGHVRYSTTGQSNIINTQPFMATHKGMPLCVAHNGNMVNSIALRQHLEQQGSIFQTAMDSEIVIHLLVRHLDKGLHEAIKTTFSCIQGAYSLLLMTQDTMIAVRDPNGFRPLCLGMLDNGAHVVASETCALDLIEAEYIRDIEPGEVLIINEQGLTSLFPWAPVRKSYCIFEHVYFARPDSNVFGFNVYAARKRMGEILANEAKIEADFVMPFPDSGNYAAIGYSNASGIPLEMGMIRNHYVGRTFIQPTQSMRDFSVRVKLNPVRSLLQGKRVIIVEDSIVRGTTGRSRVKSLRNAGAAEVHMVVSCPPTRHACYYGIDFPSSDQLIAAGNTVETIRDYLGLDSLHYLSEAGLVEATGLPHDHFCLACFSGNYPIKPDKNFTKEAFSSCGC